MESERVKIFENIDTTFKRLDTFKDANERIADLEQTSKKIAALETAIKQIGKLEFDIKTVSTSLDTSMKRFDGYE